MRFSGTVFITSVRVKGGSGEDERGGIMIWVNTGGTVIGLTTQLGWVCQGVAMVRVL